jgi:glycine dehydrogenase subunit 2
VKLIFDKSVPGRTGCLPPSDDTASEPRIDESLMRPRQAPLPELSELDVVRHFTELSTRNFGVDTGFYPLGSCTMKYNPKIAERIARHEGFTALHPELARIEGGEKLTQGALAILYHTNLLLGEICGMAAFTSQPMAGANGELTGVLLIAAYHRSKGNDHKRTILIPDSAHGTNPASAALAGYEVRTIGSDENGLMDLDALKEACTDEVAGVMLTCPNTLGLFNPHVKEICDAVHEVDGLAYYDGANLNALLGRAKPGDLGFDIVHVNLHKTFATPHGGGGPGAGPVGVCEKLAGFLPRPRVVLEEGRYRLEKEMPDSIGKIAAWYGSFGIIVRAYAYMLRLGRKGMLDVSEHAVLNANYIRACLEEHYELPFKQICMHECVFSAKRQVEHEVHAMDIAKALIDRGYHPPTVYFPLIVEEAMMVEPTETEAPETLDRFIEAMIEIAELARTDPQSLKASPVTTSVGRLDETLAARKPDLASLAGDDDG